MATASPAQHPRDHAASSTPHSQRTDADGHRPGERLAERTGRRRGRPGSGGCGGRAAPEDQAGQVVEREADGEPGVPRSTRTTRRRKAAGAASSRRKTASEPNVHRWTGDRCSRFRGKVSTSGQAEELVGEFGHLVDALEDEERPEHGQDEVERQQPADDGGEEQRAEALEPAEVDLAAAVDAVEPGGEVAVEADERVAGEERHRAGEVGQLELVARQARRAGRRGSGSRAR